MSRIAIFCPSSLVFASIAIVPCPYVSSYSWEAELRHDLRTFGVDLCVDHFSRYERQQKQQERSGHVRDYISGRDYHLDWGAALRTSVLLFS